MVELNEKEIAKANKEQVERLMCIVTQQNEQIQCLTELCKCNTNTVKEMSISHNKSFTSALIATLASVTVIVGMITAMWLFYENQFTYSSSSTSVSAEGTEANAQYVGGNYNVTEQPKGSEK